jgi:hypothetical protein
LNGAPFGLSLGPGVLNRGFFFRVLSGTAAGIGRESWFIATDLDHTA